MVSISEVGFRRERAPALHLHGKRKTKKVDPPLGSGHREQKTRQAGCLPCLINQLPSVALAAASCAAFCLASQASGSTLASIRVRAFCMPA